MNAQALKDEGIDLERGTDNVQRILHGNQTASAPAPAPKTRATRSDKGTKRPAKVEPSKAAFLTREQAARLDALAIGLRTAERVKEEAENNLMMAQAAWMTYLDELQGK